jgi:hypothetical protein
MSIPSRLNNRILVLSKKKQVDYATILADSDLIAGKHFEVTAPTFGQPSTKRWSDRDLMMRGTDFGSQVVEIERDLQDSLAFPGDTWLLAWMSAFAMGKVTSTQPDNIGAPTAWQHVIKPMDPNTDGNNLPVTTIYAEASAAAGLQRRLRSCCMHTLAIDFPASSPLAVSGSFIGAGAIVSGALATPPTLSALNLLRSDDMTFAYGAQGAPVDISTQIVRGSVKFGYTANMDDANSRGPGGGLYRLRAWVGRPDISLSFQRFVDDAVSTPNDDFFASTVQEVKITVLGALIGGAVFHKIEIRGLAVVPDAVKIGQSGDKSVYQYTISPDHWLKQGAADVLTVTVVNTESSFLA